MIVHLKLEYRLFMTFLSGVIEWRLFSFVNSCIVIDNLQKKSGSIAFQRNQQTKQKILGYVCI